MDTLGFILYSIVFWTLFIGGFITIPHMIYTSIVYGLKYGWLKKKIKHHYFYYDTPLGILVISTFALLGGIYFYFWDGELIGYFESVLK